MSEDESDPRELLLTSHRKEKKELQAQIQALKKTASKGDKKKKKEVSETIANLEAKLKEKHKAELTNLEEEGLAGDHLANRESAVPEIVQKVEENSDDAALGPLPIKEEYSRVSKAQKRREKKALKEKERLEEIENQEELNKSGPRLLEQEAIKQKLTERKLKLKEIASDGDCLFSGVVHQLQRLGLSSSIRELRSNTATELRDKPDEYLPFLTNPRTGDMLTGEEFESYCDKMMNTPAWGGQIELKALSKVLKRPIQVIQGTGPDIVIGEEFQEKETILLTYHRHLHGLGEHYNSVNKE